MRKDIHIPEVKDVYLAAVREFNTDFRTYDWNVYLINDGKEPLDTVLIVSEGGDATQLTSQMRHSLKVLPAKGYAKIEFLDESVLKLYNYFKVTYFIGNSLYDKIFEFPPNSILEDNAVALPVMLEKGVLAR